MPPCVVTVTNKQKHASTAEAEISNESAHLNGLEGTHNILPPVRAAIECSMSWTSMKKQGGGGQIATVNFDIKDAVMVAGAHAIMTSICFQSEETEKSTSPSSGRVCLQQRFVGVEQYWIQKSWLPYFV